MAGNDANTVLLLHGDGINAGTSFPDASSKNHALSNGGTGAVTAVSTVKFGTASLYFNGASYLYVTDPGSDFAFGTGDFTIDLWLNLAAAPISYGPVAMLSSAITNGDIVVGVSPQQLYWQSAANNTITGTTALSLNTWYHVALVRSAGTVRMYLNGVQEGNTGADATNYASAGNRPLFGSDGSGYMVGFLDEVRISNVARWTSNFTPPTTPYTPTNVLTATALAPSSPTFGPAYNGSPALTHPDAYTVLLLHCDGANGATTFTDQSGKNHTVAPNGAVVTTGAQKFGNASALVNGIDFTGLTLDGSSDFAFGTGDFTIDFWVAIGVLPASGAACTLYDGRGSPTSNLAPVIQVLNTAGTCKLLYAAGALGAVITGTTTLSAGIWYHVALARIAGVTGLYLNGGLEGFAAADANNYIAPASAPIIGGSSGIAGRALQGYMDEVRVSKGVARWTTAFTPPTAPYPPYQFVANSLAPASPYLGPAWPFQAIDAATVLLLHCDGVNGSTIVPDTSGRNHPVTPSGTAKLAVAQKEFGSASAIFDNSGGCYLGLDGSSDFAFGTGDFTIDFWVRFNSITPTIGQLIYDSRPAGSASAIAPLIYYDGGFIAYMVSGAEQIIGTTAPLPNVWYHVALVRASGTTKLYLNGTQEGASYTDANNYVVGASRPLLAGNGNVPASANCLNGYLDEVRVSKGVARWPGNFSVPQAPYGYLFNPTALATASPSLGAPLASSGMAALNLATASPTFGTPALTHFFALHALDLVTGSPYIGLGYGIGVLAATSLHTASPVVPIDPVLHQHPQNIYAGDLVTASPDLGKPARIPSPPPTYPADMDRHVRRTGGDYAHALIDLLPRGQAWPRDPGSTLIQALTGLAQFYGYVDGRAADLLERESDPRATLELLPDWERNWGLPDPCFKEAKTIGERRDMLVMIMTLLGGQSRDFFYSVATLMGYAIFIEEYSPFMCGISRCGDTTAFYDGVHPRWQIGRPEMRFYWTIHITNASLNWFRASQGQAGVDPHLRIGLFIDEDCIFRRWKPAHTDIVYSYANLQQGHSMDGTP